MGIFSRDLTTRVANDDAIEDMKDTKLYELALADTGSDAGKQANLVIAKQEELFKEYRKEDLSWRERRAIKKEFKRWRKSFNKSNELLIERNKEHRRYWTSQERGVGRLTTAGFDIIRDDPAHFQGTEKKNQAYREASLKNRAASEDPPDEVQKEAEQAADEARLAASEDQTVITNESGTIIMRTSKVEVEGSEKEAAKKEARDLAKGQADYDEAKKAVDDAEGVAKDCGGFSGLPAMNLDKLRDWKDKLAFRISGHGRGLRRIAAWAQGAYNSAQSKIYALIARAQISCPAVWAKSGLKNLRKLKKNVEKARDSETMAMLVDAAKNNGNSGALLGNLTKTLPEGFGPLSTARLNKIAEIAEKYDVDTKGFYRDGEGRVSFGQDAYSSSSIGKLDKMLGKSSNAGAKVGAELAIKDVDEIRAMNVAADRAARERLGNDDNINHADAIAGVVNTNVDDDDPTKVKPEAVKMGAVTSSLQKTRDYMGDRIKEVTDSTDDMWRAYHADRTAKRLSKESTSHASQLDVKDVFRARYYDQKQHQPIRSDFIGHGSGTLSA